MRKTVTPSCAQALDEVADLAPPDRVDAVGRLVEEDDARAVHERLREPEPLQHALRVGPDAAVGGVCEADAARAGRARARRGRRAETPCMRASTSSASRPVRNGGKRWPSGRKPVGTARRGSRDVHAEDLGRAGRRADEAEQQLDERRLAGPVGPEQAERLAGGDATA